MTARPDPPLSSYSNDANAYAAEDDELCSKLLPSAAPADSGRLHLRVDGLDALDHGV